MPDPVLRSPKVADLICSAQESRKTPHSHDGQGATGRATCQPSGVFDGDLPAVLQFAERAHPRLQTFVGHVPEQLGPLAEDR